MYQGGEKKGSKESAEDLRNKRKPGKDLWWKEHAKEGQEKGGRVRDEKRGESKTLGGVGPQKEAKIATAREEGGGVVSDVP